MVVGDPVASEQVSVAVLSDDGALGVIGLPNDELAGSLRNTSRRGTRSSMR